MSSWFAPFAGLWADLTTPMRWALCLSLGLHVALGVTRFVDSESFQRLMKDTPLDVILVNARSDEPPLNPQALAQATLSGGGELDEGRAQSPLPAAAHTSLGDALDETRQQIEQLQQNQQQLLAQIHREVALLPPPTPSGKNREAAQQAQEQHRQQLLQLLAEIEKRVNEENARPKKRYISPSTREVPYALYYDRYRKKVEEQGTRNFPEFKGKKLYGELIVNVTVDARGEVVETEVLRPSSSPQLDRRALAIVRSAAPFGPFSPEMAHIDQVVFTARFRFTRDDGLETTMMGTLGSP
jgi:protein TonB